jgi:arylamine N-acetyltransferase
MVVDGDPRTLPEFLPRCRYQEHDPASHFRTRRLAVMNVDHGRISLVDGVFSETGQPERTVDADEERQLLVDRYGIVLPSLWSSLRPAGRRC